MNESQHPVQGLDPALVLRDAAFPFGTGNGGRIRGLSDIHLEVKRGERLLLVGPSGVGKTTLLKGIAGLTPLLAGTVHVLGQNVTALPPEARGAVYLHQSPVLFPHRTVEGNVAFPLEVRGVPRSEIAFRVQEVLDAVHMGALSTREIGALSGGERHRVALARAVVACPPLLLLDEPLTALDPALRAEVREAILTLQTRYAPGLVLVTHDLVDVGHLAHRVGVLLNGTLAQVASPKELFQNPASLAVARFLGMGPELEVTRDAGYWQHPDLGRVTPVRAGQAGEAGKAVIILPPTALSIQRHPQAEASPSVPAILESVQYPGPTPTASLRVGDGNVRFSIPLHGPDQPQVGENVLVTWDPDRIRVYPHPNGS